jgi:hypothetical protein
MESKLFFDKKSTFNIENYNTAPAFSNFLPGVAGRWGIPLWAFYVNRGQALVSFGIQDKDHAIAEFCSAEKAYRLAPLFGFRTFLKVNGKYYEPFSINSNSRQRMQVQSHDLTLQDYSQLHNLSVNVNYFTLPNTDYGCLARELTIKNTSTQNIQLEVVDGLARIIPFGTNDFFLKNLSRTVEGWMNSYSRKGMGVFRLLVDPQDVAETKFIQGANFGYGLTDDRSSLHQVIINPRDIFGEDTSLTLPLMFLENKMDLSRQNSLVGRMPCCFNYMEWHLAPGQERKFVSLWGTVFDKKELNKVKKTNLALVKGKKQENYRVVQSIKNNALSVSGSPVFDNYLRSTYLDNILRGGYPYSTKKNNVYYIYGRKHGDLERDYNQFEFFPSYFSEGEANYRDLNQNRRMDLFFNPYIDKDNIVYFLNFIKIDGYNPLRIKGEKIYFTSAKSISKLLKKFKLKSTKKLNDLLKKGFSLGELFNLLREEDNLPRAKEEFVDYILSQAHREPAADFGEGYWVDHWHYNLDLIDAYLYFYPDKLSELFLETDFLFWDDSHQVKRRKERYYLKGEKVIQDQSLKNSTEKEKEINTRRHYKNFLRITKGRHKLYRSNLMVKLLSLILNKSATFDSYGLGIEMEADKPGWCDSLNGLPALFGSSLCETLELKRACRLLLTAIDNLDKNITLELPQELYSFFTRMNKLITSYKRKRKNRDYFWWDKSNEIKEDFRKSTFWGLRGEFKKISLAKIAAFIEEIITRIDNHLPQAKDKKSGLYYSYFYYQLQDFKVNKNKTIKPLKFKKMNIPLFLESPMHALRLSHDHRIAKKMVKSPLYDKKLKMYRLNAPLKSAPLEIGRSRIFPPGWLENETVWLHMEYKYLLEMLKAGMYKQFYKNFYNCLVCFFDPAVYGRSTLENSSFVVSSAHQDSHLWGRGFVARLTGATAELINIWILLCMGHEPFFVNQKGELSIRFSPILDKRMFTDKSRQIKFNGKTVNIPKNSLAFNLFSSILVVYHNPQAKNIFNRTPKKIIVDQYGSKHFIDSPIITEPLSSLIRDKQVNRIDVYFG